MSALIEFPAAMRSYAYGSRGDDFRDWCAEHLLQSIDRFDGEPLTLEGWQEQMMAEALAVDADSRPYWRSVAFVLPRKNGKTTLLASYALYHLLNSDGSPEVLLAAASDKQAGRLFDSVAAFIRYAPELSAVLHVREWQGEIARADGGGRILRMSSSPERLHGYNPSLVIADEVARWTTPSLRRAWAALTTGGGARTLAQTFTISTAGEAHERGDGILGRLIDANEAQGDTEHTGALTVSRNHDARTVVYNYSAPTEDPENIAAIRLANPASWITDDYLRKQSVNPELMASEFLQLHGCVWSEAEDAWLNLEDWRRLATDRVLAPGEKITLGFDGARVEDATALVACAFDEPHLEVLAAWERPPGAAGRGWEVPGGEVDAAVADAFETYRVVRANFDPPLWQTEISGWRQEFGGLVHDWPTNQPRRMAGAVERLRTDALAGRFTHGDQPVLNRHVGNARLHRHRGGYWLEKPRLRGPDHIDAAVAAVLAYAARAESVEAGEGIRSRVPISWS